MEVQKLVPYPEPAKYVSMLPYSEAIKAQYEEELSKIFEHYQKLTINIPFAEALDQIQSYASFMKQNLSKMKWLEEFETIALNEEYNVVLQRKLLPELKDQGRFIIYYDIASNFSCKAFCDLGTSIKSIRLSIYKKLWLGEVKPTTVKL